MRFLDLTVYERKLLDSIKVTTVNLILCRNLTGFIILHILK